MEATAVAHHHTSQHNEDDYEAFLDSIREHFEGIVQDDAHLFTTNAEDLFGVFLAQLPEGEIRQHYTCHACKRFVNTYGGLVTISMSGAVYPVMWPEEIPEMYRASVEACGMAVLKAKVTGVFLSSKTTWGQPATGEWHHMHVKANGCAYRGKVQTAGQVMAEKREDFATLIRGLNAFPIEAVDQAITLLKTESLYRSEKLLGVAEWLRNVHAMRASTRNNISKRDLLWRAVAMAPAGFCHVRSTMIGTLLQDIVDGLSFDAVSRRFASKMHPLQYQRPQALPSRGNIAQAEKVIEKLQAAGALERRFARLDEIQTVWLPRAQQQDQGGDGVFGHLQAKEDKPIRQMDVPATSITWEKFSRTVLPDVERIEFHVQHKRDGYCAIVTATNADAPPILQWDTDADRNPFSHYVYTNGSLPSQWGLRNDGLQAVTGICLQPSMWNGGYEHHSSSVIFILDRCRDTINESLALFPETLKSEFHGIRSTIESFSRRGKITGFDEASACGIRLQKGSAFLHKFLVTIKGTKIEYVLDRWD